MGYTKKQLLPIYKKLINKLPLIVVGSWRRNKPIIKDLDFISYITLDKVARILKLPKVKETRRKITFKIKYHKISIHVDIFYVKRIERIFAMLHYTGNKWFNVALRNHAKKLGYKLNQYGLYKHNKRVYVKNERHIFKLLKFSYRSPHHRDIGEPTHIHLA